MPLKIKHALYYVAFPENVFLSVFFFVYTQKSATTIKNNTKATIAKAHTLRKYEATFNMLFVTRMTAQVVRDRLRNTIYFPTSAIGLEESKSNTEKQNGTVISSFCHILSPK